MSFDLEAHLKQHAFIFQKLSNLSSTSIHFNFSFLDLQFLDKNVGDTMSNLLDALLQPTEYNVANGKRKDRHGNVIQKFSLRKVNLQKDVQALAIHLKGPEGEDTMPHIHFIADGAARFGNGYSLLKKHVSTVSEQFGLLPNFDEIAEHNPLSVKSLSKSVSQITWSWKKSTNSQLKKEIRTRGLNKSISLLESYTLKTKSLTYYIKSMEGLKTRLNRMKLDLTYNKHNLRNTYPIPLTHEDMAVITLLQKKDFTQKSIKPYLKNPIFRDFIRHSANTTKPYIYDALKEQTSLLDGVYKNSLAVDNYQKLMMKVTPLRKSQLTPKDNQRLSRKNELRRIIIEASQSATNEKSFSSLIQNVGYTNFGLKKKQGKVIGCMYEEVDSKRTLNFTDLGLHWAELKKSFMSNSRKLDNGETLPSPSLIKKEPTAKETQASQKRTKKPDTVPIVYKDKEIAITKKKAKEKSRTRRAYEKLIPRIKTEIIKFEDFISRLKDGISNFREKISSLGKRVSSTRYTREELNKDKATESVQSKDIEYIRNKISENTRLQSSLTLRWDEARKMEYKNGTACDSFKEAISREDTVQSKFENGDYEYYLRERFTKDISDRKRDNQELKEKISQIEGKNTLKNIPEHEYTPSPSNMRP